MQDDARHVRASLGHATPAGTLVFIVTLVFVINGGVFAQSEGPKPSSTVLAPQNATVPTSQPGSAMPDVAFEDLALLVKNARRAFRAVVQELPERSAGYKPPDLMGLRGIVHLTLRHGGAVIAEAESGELPILDASVAAGTLLGRAVIAKKLRLEASGDELGLEFEWLGSRSPIDVPYYEQNGSWTDALLHAFEPATEGIGVEFQGRRGWTRPAQIVSLNYSPDLALKGAETVIDLKQIQKMRFAKEIRYFRFWALHLWQPRAAELPVRLLRGDTLVPPESVDVAAMDAAIGRIGTYLRFRQNSNGGFAEEYLPAGDVYNEANSAAAQLKSLYGLTVFSVWTDDGEAKGDMRKSFDSFGKYIKPQMIRQVGSDGKAIEKEGGALLDLPGHGRQLELSARLLMCSSNASDSGQEEIRSKLIRGLLAAQTEEGCFALPDLVEDVEDPDDVAASQPAKKPAPDDLANACVLLALSTTRGSSSQEAIEKAIDRASIYYLRKPTTALRTTAVITLSRAFAQYYVISNDARVSDFVFAVADRLTALQVTAETCPYPELYGAINIRALGEVGADSAVCLSALADALSLAERIGDQVRVDRYRKAAHAATRFILQLEVRAPGTYFMRMPRAALGGIRIALWSNRIRSDNCAAAVEALIRARIALYGPRQAS